jgi:hypothetical protein
VQSELHEAIADPFRGCIMPMVLSIRWAKFARMNVQAVEWASQLAVHAVSRASLSRPVMSLWTETSREAALLPVLECVDLARSLSRGLDVALAKARNLQQGWYSKPLLAQILLADPQSPCMRGLWLNAMAIISQSSPSDLEGRKLADQTLAEHPARPCSPARGPARSGRLPYRGYSGTIKNNKLTPADITDQIYFPSRPIRNRSKDCLPRSTKRRAGDQWLPRDW